MLRSMARAAAPLPLTTEQRRQYRDELKSVARDLRKLSPSVPDKARMQKVSRCVENVIADLGNAI